MLKQISVHITIAILLCSCASQIAPTGGAKDEIPPAVVRSNPENLAIHFQSKKISITFDEFIQAGDFSSQVFFSPALDGKPQFRVHGKTLSITLNSPLKPKTTYTVNFGNSVKDITEGNIMVNYQYVFSTGDFIDSMRIQGLVKGAEDGLPKENAIVELYDDLSDSAVAKGRPTYYAHSDKAGSFLISHVKEGTYKLFALNDQNFNLLYDQPGEDVAFLDSSIEVKDTAGFYSMVMFKPVAPKQKVFYSNSSQPGKITVGLAKRTDNLHIIPLTGTAKNGVEQFNATRDTFYFWLNDFITDSIKLAIADGDFSDTVDVRMKTVNEKEKIFAPKFRVVSSQKRGISLYQQEPDKPFQFEFSTPVVSVNEKRMLRLINDSSKTTEEVKAELFSDTTTLKQKASITFPFAEKVKYTLFIPDSAFSDVFGNFNDSTHLNFITFEKSDNGNLILKITTDSTKKYFFELRPVGGELLAKGKLKPGFNELKFNALRPGAYNLRVIDDLNNNERWDTGDYWKHLQPEKIYNYADQITLRANWDLEVEMNVGVERKLSKGEMILCKRCYAILKNLS